MKYLEHIHNTMRMYENMTTCRPDTVIFQPETFFKIEKEIFDNYPSHKSFTILQKKNGEGEWTRGQILGMDFEVDEEIPEPIRVYNKDHFIRVLKREKKVLGIELDMEMIVKYGEEKVWDLLRIQGFEKGNPTTRIENDDRLMRRRVTQEIEVLTYVPFKEEAKMWLQDVDDKLDMTLKILRGLIYDAK